MTIYNKNLSYKSYLFIDMIISYDVYKYQELS